MEPPGPQLPGDQREPKDSGIALRSAQVPARLGPDDEARPPTRAVAAAGWLIDDLPTAAATATAAVLLSSTGDAFLVAALLAFAAASPQSARPPSADGGREAQGVVPAAVVTGVVAALVALAAAVRWGSSSVEAIAGAQAVLGPAGLVGSPGEVASSWMGAAALLAVIPGRRPTQPSQAALAAAFGVSAAALVTGAVVTGMESGLQRLGASAIATGLAWLLSVHAAGRGSARAVGLALAAASVAAAAFG